MPSADDLIRHFHLQPHPQEGGFFRETYRSTQTSLVPAYDSPRHLSTAIYYLLTPDTFSALHRLKSDEVFHFYLGDPIRMVQLDPKNGASQTIILGPDILQGQHVQIVVPQGVWQGSHLEPGGKWALIGCTVAPGFEYADYETGLRADLLAQFPGQVEAIGRLTGA